MGDDVIEAVGDGAECGLVGCGGRLGCEINGECLIPVVQYIQACSERGYALAEVGRVEVARLEGVLVALDRSFGPGQSP